MMTRLIRIQLTIFALVSVVTVVAVALFYLHIPEKTGITTYEVHAEFASGGGIYPHANVTYLGVEVGRVDGVSFGNDRTVVVHMRLDKDVSIPADVTATVKSMSAIGEQYVDLVDPAHHWPGVAKLAQGARIGKDRTGVGQEIAPLLKQAEALVRSIGDSRLQQLLDELFKAFNGSGPDLARILAAAGPLVTEANANWPQTSRLLDDVGPLLAAQITSGSDIKATLDGLARFTTQLRKADPQFRDLLSTVPGAADAATQTFDGIRPTFPVLAASLADLGRIGVIYHKAFEQILVLLPATLSAIVTVAGGSPIDEGGKLDFKLSLDPPPCMVGFLPPSAVRSPAVEELQELPKDLYCKIPQDAPSAVRGARNYPCQEFPGKRAPTIQLCRDPRGYVPIGSNPWRGPPVPVGTPVTNPRNILPPNKYPMIAPGTDTDPGTPYPPGFLPPGAQVGPGPAPNQPWPIQPPPANGPPPPPFTSWRPADPYPPPGPGNFPAPGPGNNLFAPPPPEGNPGPAPAAQGSGYTTYDQRTGTFVAPTGEVGVFAAGRSGLRPSETWLELMRDPCPE